jgi:tetratricopeptide (TPR) repeat protein
MKRLAATVLFALPLFGAANLELLRDRQDRTGLTQGAAELAAAAEKSPENADAWYRAAIAQSYLAEVAMELGDKAGAQHAAEDGVRQAEKAIALKAANPDYYRVLGTLCGQVIPANPIAGALSYGKRAKDALDKAIEMDPKSARAYVAHGVGYYYLPASFGGGPANAIKDFQKALALDPKLADAWLWMGIAQHRLNQNPQAREAFTKALQFAPERKWAKTQLDKTPAQ